MESSKNEVNKSQTSIFQIDNYSSQMQLTDDGKFSSQKADGEYDPFLQRDVKLPTSDAGSLAHLLKSSLGSGILSMPNAFMHAGLTFGMVGTLVIGLLCTHCVHILVKSSHIVCKKGKVPSLTFAETAEMAFKTGPEKIRRYSTFALNFVNSSLIITYYSSACVYVVLIAESTKKVCDHYFQGSDLDIRIYIVIYLLPLCLLCLVRNLRYLVPFSAMANVFIIISLAITLYYMFVDLPSPDTTEQIVSAEKMPIFFSTVIFAMEGIGVVMPVENNMKNPGHFLGCPGILNIAMGVVVSLYAVLGFFGYLRYGSETKPSITFNLDIKEVPAQIVNILIPLAIMFTYPLQFFVPTSIVLTGLENRTYTQNMFFQNGYRIALVALTVAVAAALPNLGPIISLVGAVCFSTLGLFCPAVIETIACWDGELGVGRWRLYKNIVISVFAILALIAGTYTSIEDIIKTY